MGSKRALLSGSLGDLILEEAASSSRFVDLFSGTGQVSWHVAERLPTAVCSVDLQEYARVLASSIVERTCGISARRAESEWLQPAMDSLKSATMYSLLSETDWSESAASVHAARHLCNTTDGGLIWRSYGGHYFSPLQAATLDSLLEFLPTGDCDLVTVCRATMILSASRCAAAPGHTAQPFQPRNNGLQYIRSSWRRDPEALVRDLLEDLAPRHALKRGRAETGDANAWSQTLETDDLVFIDPPYSSVQYSRFYHVLETIARGECGSVDGVGRYPPRIERPRSLYSLRSAAASAVRDLLAHLASAGCSVILTFPAGNASNGLSGDEVCELAETWYHLDRVMVESEFSTLGGNGLNRKARLLTPELVLVMHPLGS